MREYVPDCWVIVRFIVDAEPLDKVLAGWYGGYLYGDSWRLNSGITVVKDQGDTYEFVSSSGSVYRCKKASERMSALMASVYASFEKSLHDTDASIEIISAADLNQIA